MKCIVVMEDMPSSSGCINEHGLCIYVETMKHRLLMDTGASCHTVENCKRLGIDLKQVDTIVLSHGHYDHAGGILSVLEVNPDIDIYAHCKVGLGYYHNEKYIGIDSDIMKLENIHFIDKDSVIDDELSLYTNITGRRNWPSTNSHLFKKVNDTFIQDSFDHEQCLVIHEDDKYVLMSGCAHNGILNILDRFKEIYHRDPDVVFSGFHMAQKSEYTPLDIQKIEQTAKVCKEMDTIFYTGHCTGLKAYSILKEIDEKKMNYLTLGSVIEI